MALKTSGYSNFTEDSNLNFMLNRLAWDIDHDRLVEIGKQVSCNEDFVEVMLVEAEDAESTGRNLEAGFFYRAAEFFMPPDHTKKVMAYDKFMTYFYEGTPNAAQQRKLVPYGTGKLGVIDIPAEGAERDTILLCSGFDGLIEELYSVGTLLSKAGYRVVLFEGPGQGCALRRYGLTLEHKWEAPVATILDNLNISSCTLGGISLGGYLAPRAAAFEPRVKRLIAWGAMHNWLDSLKLGMGGGVKADLNVLLVKLGCKRLINRVSYKIAAKSSKAAWGLKHGIHTTGTDSPFGFLNHTKDYHLQDAAKNITQDTLILQGGDDHLVPKEQLLIQAKSLTKAKSVTTRLFTELENGAQHCQIGNPVLVVNQILLWLEGLERRDKSCLN